MENITTNQTVKGNQWSVTLRPQTFDDVFGQDMTRDFFKSYLKENKKFPSVMFFSGIYGSGKTTFAKIVAKTLQCEHPLPDGTPCCQCPSCRDIQDEKWARDVTMIDGGQSGKADLIDDITSILSTRPFYSKQHIIIIEEAQELSQQAQNSLLKILERPSDDAYFIFTSMRQLPRGGLTSRGVVFQFKPASVSNVMDYLNNYVLAKFNMQCGTGALPDSFYLEGLKIIAENTEGSYRDALQKMEQCINAKAYTAKEISELTGMIDQESYTNVMMSVLNGECSPGVYQTLIDGDYQAHFNITYTAIADAEAYRLFGNPTDREDFRIKRSARIAAHKNFPILRDEFLQLSAFSGSFLKRSTYIIAICKILEKCRANLGLEQPSVPAQPEASVSVSVEETVMAPVAETSAPAVIPEPAAVSETPVQQTVRRVTRTVTVDSAQAPLQTAEVSAPAQPVRRVVRSVAPSVTVDTNTSTVTNSTITNSVVGNGNTVVTGRRIINR